MQVRVRYFARLREIAGRTDELVELADGSSIGELFEVLQQSYPALAGLQSHLRAARNQDFAPFETRLQENDEVAFIPPVSGGSGASPRFLVTTEVLDINAVTALVRRPEAGAIATFEGVVRDHTGPRAVEYLEYEAYVEMAVRKLSETAAEAERRWPVRAAIHHRYGRLEIGESAVMIAVSSPHRADAFDACEWVIDTLKEVVPIWKKEVGPDGAEWVSQGP